MKKQSPIFFRDHPELEGLSKAAWQDISWNLASRCAESEMDAGVHAVLLEEAKITLEYRKAHAKGVTT